MFFRNALRLSVLVSIASLFFPQPVTADTPIATHVRLLDDDDPPTRKGAEEALMSAGADALPELCAANRSAKSIELRESTRYLIRKIAYDRFEKQRLYSLQAENERFNDVLLKLAKLSGARIVSYPERINDVPISVNLRDKQFWDIVIELCRLSRNHLSAVEPYDANGDFRILRGPQRFGTVARRGKLIAFCERSEFRERGPVRSDMSYLDVSLVPEPGFRIEPAVRAPFVRRVDYDFKEGMAWGCNVVSWYKNSDGVGRATLCGRNVTGTRHLFDESVDLELTLPVRVFPAVDPVPFATVEEGVKADFFGGTTTISSIEERNIAGNNYVDLKVHSEWHPLLAPYSISVIVSQGGFPLESSLLRSTWQIDQSELSVRSLLQGDQALEVSVLVVPPPKAESAPYKFRKLKL